MTGSFAVRRAAGRPHTIGEGRDTAHSLSFGSHYDPDNLSFGPLLALNTDVLAPGAGYEPHRHRDLEIVTWVLEGSLGHADDRGHRSVLDAGHVQWLGAGSGVEHAEVNAAAGVTRFVQMWLAPDAPDLPVGYQHRAIAPDELRRGWLTVASGDEALSPLLAIRSARATLSATALGAGTIAAPLPASDAVLFLLTRGAVTLAGTGELSPPQTLQAGDELRLIERPVPVITAVTDCELLVWQFGS